MSDQIKSEKQLVGTTITRIVYSVDDNLVFFFDKEYAVYTVKTGYEVGDESIAFDADELTNYVKRTLGIISEDEYQIASKKESQEYYAQNEEAERTQLSRLLKKYQ